MLFMVKRLFIAVPIREKTRMQIVRGILNQDFVRKMPVRWVPYENLHLTVQFLGDVEEKRIPELKQILNSFESIFRENLKISNIGAFPGPTAPKIIWIGFKRSDMLQKIQRQLTFSLLDKGFSVDHKPYKPHLTIGRVRDNVVIASDQFARLEGLTAKTEISDTPLDRLTLFDSQLRPGGPIYTALYEKVLCS